MRKKSEIIKRQNEARNMADRILSQANKAEDDGIRDMYIRMYNKTMNDIYILEWVLED